VSSLNVGNGTASRVTRRDVEERAQHYDPAIVPLLPVVRPRIDAACLVVHAALVSYRTFHSCS